MEQSECCWLFGLTGCRLSQQYKLSFCCCLHDSVFGDCRSVSQNQMRLNRKINDMMWSRIPWEAVARATWSSTNPEKSAKQLCVLLDQIHAGGQVCNAERSTACSIAGKYTVKLKSTGLLGWNAVLKYSLDLGYRSSCYFQLALWNVLCPCPLIEKPSQRSSWRKGMSSCVTSSAILDSLAPGHKHCQIRIQIRMQHKKTWTFALTFWVYEAWTWSDQPLQSS